MRGWSDETTQPVPTGNSRASSAEVMKHPGEHPAGWAALCSIPSKFGMGQKRCACGCAGCAGTRPVTTQAVPFIHTHRDRSGIEPICRVLSSAPATYVDWFNRRRLQ